MKTRYIDVMNSFDIHSLPDLDICVMAALELLSSAKLPKINSRACKRPMVIGSGNAVPTGKILFEDQDAVFANESNYKEKLKSIPSIDGVFLISASGSKHSIEIAKYIRKKKMKCFLLTCNANAPAGKYIEKNKIFVFPKNREPYTYNTSTYLGMIFAKTKENPLNIKKFIESNINAAIPSDIGSCHGYYLMLPEKFDSIREMFNTKFIELFGRNVSRDVFTMEQTRHATTVVPSDELLIQFGKTSIDTGIKKIVIPLPPSANYAAMMAIGYYVIGKIQAGKPPYFKQNLANYCKKTSVLFNQEIRPIVE
jgi:hypothetical protein